MEQVSLPNWTGDAAVGETLRDTVAAFEAAFPGRVRGYYVEGSYADGTGIATSVLDLTIVFRGAFHDEAERSQAGRLGDERAADGEIPDPPSFARICRGLSIAEG